MLLLVLPAVVGVIIAAAAAFAGVIEAASGDTAIAMMIGCSQIENIAIRTRVYVLCYTVRHAAKSHMRIVPRNVQYYTRNMLKKLHQCFHQYKTKTKGFTKKSFKQKRYPCSYLTNFM